MGSLGAQRGAGESWPVTEILAFAAEWADTVVAPKPVMAMPMTNARTMRLFILWVTFQVSNADLRFLWTNQMNTT